MLESKPNILLIVCDQFRWDCLGAKGHPTVRTPNLDTLAAQGVLFDRAYSAVPSCIAARANLFTGLSPDKTGFLGYRDGVEWGYANMLPQLLRDNGYQTHCVGKTHFFPQRKHCGFEGLDSYESWQSFDSHYQNDYHRWLADKSGGDLNELNHGMGDNDWTARPSTLPEELHVNTWTVTKALEFVERRDHTRPYFLNVSFHRPHPPVDPPQHYWDEYMALPMQEPAIGDWCNVYDHPPDSLNCWCGRLEERELKKLRHGYFAQIAHIDTQIGRLLLALRYRKEAPDLIVFTSDHGEMLGDHHLFRKTYPYQGSAAVPLIIWSTQDACSAGIRTAVPVVLQDIYTTVLDYAGIAPPCDTDGLSLRPVVAGAADLPREYIHGEHSACYSEDMAMQYLTDGRYKYIWFTKDGREQLFDLDADPEELHDLSRNSAYSDVLALWRNRLAQELRCRTCDGITDGASLTPALTPAYRTHTGF